MSAAAGAAERRKRHPVSEAEGAPGRGLAILVNANAKRGGRRVAVQIAHVLPGASVFLTRSPEEIDAWLRVLPAPRAILAAGGDGTAIALVNALSRVRSDSSPLPVVGVLPLGTGNGWAHALGAPHLDRCLQLLARSHGPLPTRACGLVDVEGTLAHFAGSGWDAMILEDYKSQLARAATGWPRLSKTVYGYVAAALLKTAPKVALFGNPSVVIENLGERVYAVADDGRPRLMPRVEVGTVLYEGAAGTAAVGTCPEYGYGFRAFPFAERIPGFVNVRVYAQSAARAVAALPRLWRGAHPIAGMHDWFATHVRMTFSRPVPVQVGGDAFGSRRVIEYRAARLVVPMLDWRRLSATQAT